jgi:hypothetical protein
VTESRIIVVSYLANAPFSPRGIRARAVVEGLRHVSSVELIAGPADKSQSSASPRVGRRPLRKALHFVHSSFLLDKFELWSRRRFASWRPRADGALLIGFPFSPLVYASRRLVEAGIPYVVDAGDPWVLTTAGGRPANRYLARLRAGRAERRLWERAAGAIVTTDDQANALRTIFPQLPTLVRPNGFVPLAQDGRSSDTGRRRRTSNSILRLVHFGDIYVARLRVEPFFARLARSGRWERVEFHQYGSDWTGVLKERRDIDVIFHEQRPWAEIVEAAAEYDLAVVIGNRDPSALPSKAVSYLQLPIPRLALVEDDRTAALARYVADKPGWIVLRADQSDAVELIAIHIARGWTLAELQPPASEAWERVSGEITQFVVKALKR